MRITKALRRSPRSAARVEDWPLWLADFAPDYWDAFAVESIAGRRPASWAALALSGAEAAHRAFGTLIWRSAMGFELAPRGADQTLAGWRIVADTDEQFVLQADGSRYAGRMYFSHDDGSLVWTTALRYLRPEADRLWKVLGPVHRSVAPLSLTRARHVLGRHD